MTFPKSMLALVDGATTKFNPLIANGLAVSHMAYVEEYVDSFFRVTAAGFPAGLTYDGCQKCTPLQEYAFATKKKGNRCVFDVARSDVYLMEYKFSYKGEKLDSKFIYLPFVSKAGTIYISGSRFVISPILADRVISVGMSSVFLRLSKAKLTFNRIAQHYVANMDRETVQVAWGQIYNKKVTANAPKPTVRAHCTLVHYLLCKYGFTEMFRRFGGCDPVFGGEEIDEISYPESDWIICRATGMRPKGYGKLLHYPVSTIRVAISRSHYTQQVKNLLAGFFYVVDHFPASVEPKYMDYTSMWMVLMGHLIWSGDVGHGKLLQDVQDHISSLDEYIDVITRDKLEAIGHHVEHFYDLLAIVIERFHEWNMSSEDRVSTMYDKELSILPFVLYEITSPINNLYFKLKAASKKELVKTKVANIMTMHLKPGLIFRITKEHGEVTTTSTSGDNMALKITNLLVPQSSSSRNKSKKDRVAISDPGKRLHVSILEVGQAFSLPKSEPSGRSRVALTLKLNEAGLVLRNPEFAELLDSVQAKIRR